MRSYDRSSFSHSQVSAALAVGACMQVEVARGALPERNKHKLLDDLPAPDQDDEEVNAKSSKLDAFSHLLGGLALGFP